MTTEALIEKVREKHGPLDTKSEQILVTAMNILRETETPRARTMPKQPEDNFIGQNITLEEYEALPEAEKVRYQGNAEHLNKDWIDAKMEELDAKWIMVIDGRVVRYGASLRNFPEHDELIGICNTTGKYPFVFMSEKLFFIEEASM